MARTVGSSGHKTMQAILDAGIELIYTHGYEAMSLRRLAARVGIQQGSLYNHIDNKQDILFAIMSAHMDELLAELNAALAGLEGPLDLVRAFVRFHVTHHIERKKGVFLFYYEHRSLSPENYERIVAYRRVYEHTLISILEKGAAAGVFAIADPQVSAYALLAMLTGVCTWFDPQGRLGKDEVVRIYTDMALKALRP